MCVTLRQIEGTWPLPTGVLLKDEAHLAEWLGVNIIAWMSSGVHID